MTPIHNANGRERFLLVILSGIFGLLLGGFLGQGIVALAGVPSFPVGIQALSSGVPLPLDLSTLEEIRVSHPHVRSSFGKLPLQFEMNQGQTDPEVKFLSRGSGYTMFLTPTEAVLVLRNNTREVLSVKREVEPLTSNQQPATSNDLLSTSDQQRATSDDLQNPNDESQGTSDEPGATASVLRMSFAAANQTPKVTGKDKIPGIVNYFIGNDPDKWRTKIPTYKKVHYKNLYEGIDLAYYGNQGQLEYDLIVEPGADPNQIQLAFEGTDNLSVNEDGDLVLNVNRGDLRLLKPHVYQMEDNKKIKIAANYVLHSPAKVGVAPTQNPSLYASRSTSEATRTPSAQQQATGSSVGIQLAAYDSTKPLIIDPVLIWSTYLGTSAFDNANGIAVDAAGAVYVTGRAGAAGFPGALGNPIQPLGNAGGQDVFVIKINSTGTSIVYSTYMGTIGIDSGFGIAVDAMGAAYVTGQTTAAGFPEALGNPIQPLGLAGNDDGFVVKLSPLGTAIEYATYLGTNNIDISINIAVDQRGAAYVTGIVGGGGLPGTSLSLIQPGNAGGFDAFVAKINPAGTAIDYATYLGTTSLDVGRDIAVDGAGAAYVIGGTLAAGFPQALGNPIQPAGHAGDEDVFVVKINPGGTMIDYATYVGTSTDDFGIGIAVDGAGAAYITGQTFAAGFPGTSSSPIQNTFAGGVGSDVFVAKLNSAGTAIEYATYLGTNTTDAGNGIAVDGAGAVYVTGQTDGGGFPGTSGGTIQPGGHAGSGDAFLAKLNASGTAIDYATYLGTNSFDRGVGIAVDAAGTVVVAGTTTASGFPLALGSPIQPLGYAGNDDAFVSKICNDPPPGTDPGTWRETVGSMSGPRLQFASALLPDGNVLIAGGSAGGSIFVPLSSAEIFQTNTGTFVSTGSMGTERESSSGILLPNGQVLISGGFNNVSGNEISAELYDPENGTFSPTGDMQVARAFHTSVVLPDGKVFIAGGVGDPPNFSLASVELYDPDTGLFSASPPGPMNVPRQGATTTVLADGRVLIVGGAPSTGLSLASAEIYDPTSQEFSFTGSMSSPRSSHSATLLPNGKVLIHGGLDNSDGVNGFTLDSAELYDPTTGTFTLAGSSNFPNLDHFVTLLPNGQVLVAGGSFATDETFTEFVVLNSAELYNPSTGQFTFTGNLTTPRWTPVPNPIVLPNGQVLLVGGSSDTGNNGGVINGLATAELYTPTLCEPEPPTNLVAVDTPNDAGEGIDLTWTPSTTGTVLEQRLFSSTTPGGPFSLLATFFDNTTASFTDFGISPGITRFYLLRSFDGVLESGPTLEASATPSDNTPTVAVAIGTENVNEDAANSLLDLSEIFADPDPGDVLTLSVTGNTNPSVVMASLLGTTLTLDYQPDQHGLADIIVRATDLGGLFVEDVLRVTVAAVEDAPMVNTQLPDIPVQGGNPPTPAQTVIDLTDHFSDPDIATDGDVLTFTVIGNTNTSIVSTNITGDLLTLTYGLNQPTGTATVTIEAQDTTTPSPLAVADGIDVVMQGAAPPPTFTLDLTFTENLATWLPTVGAPVTITGTVLQNGVPMNPPPTVTYSVPGTWQGAANPTAALGAYTNDPNQTPTVDFTTQDVGNNQFLVMAQDYGGRIRVEMSSTFIDPTSGFEVTRAAGVTLPQDDDHDQLADVWENQHGGLGLTAAQDTDTSMGTSNQGDGLTAQEEYRGFIWGPELVPIGPVGPTETYQTGGFVLDPAFVPGNAPHVRGNPARKDLFVRVTNYDMPGFDAACECAFALGAAYEAIQLDVHVRSTEVIEPLAGEAHLDFVQLTNRDDIVNRVAGDDGHLNRGGPRNWSWDRKGESCRGDATTYAGLLSTGAPCSTPFTETYQVPLDFYFSDRPYLDGDTYEGEPLVNVGGPNGVLDPTHEVFTPFSPSQVNTTDAFALTTTCAQAGDASLGDHFKFATGSNALCFEESPGVTAVDINTNGRVELGANVSQEPEDDLSGDEATKAQVLKQTITHELGHAIGIEHDDGDPTCVMPSSTNAWVRDGCLSTTSQSQVLIHNE